MRYLCSNIENGVVRRKEVGFVGPEGDDGGEDQQKQRGDDGDLQLEPQGGASVHWRNQENTLEAAVIDYSWIVFPLGWVG
jgi:hypothetical protein